MSIQSQLLASMVNSQNKLPDNESSNLKSSNVQLDRNVQLNSSQVNDHSVKSIKSSDMMSNGAHQLKHKERKSSQLNGQQYSSNGHSLNSSQISSLSSTCESIKESESLSNRDSNNQLNDRSIDLPNDHKSTSPTENRLTNSIVHDLFPNVIFDLKELFRLSVRFTRENENKAFHPTYDDRKNLYALNYQIKYGQFVEDKAPQLGAFDLVGKDRRLAWKELGDLSKEEAMKQFISKLDHICSSFKPFIEAHNQERVERERKLREEEERKRIEEDRRFEEEMQERSKKAEDERKEKQRQQIKEALRKQTYHQFKSYALQQYPNDTEAQDQLIKSLEDIHFQQYLERIEQIQEQNQMNPSAINAQQDELTFSMQQFNLKDTKAPADANSDDHLTNSVDNEYSKIDQKEYVNSQRYMMNQEESENDDEEEDEEHSEESDNEEEFEEHYEGKSFEVAPPNMWTKKIIKPFKESISMMDSGDGIVKVGYGETLTIRVPTHPDGNCIVWEFATDSYDIGFGLFFEPNDNPGDQVTIQISESEDEEEEEDEQDNDDPEKGGQRRESKKSKTQYVLPIIPIFRRDSHEEVYAGSHVYCGKGVYLLKFDNTYSLWRSKTLYYRVFFSS